ncbi:MAG: patatin-like phospholipase family protein [Pseudomonadota bacterium]
MALNRKTRTALVLSGGGTRGAYEAGVIHYIRTMLPGELSRRFQFHIQCGSSVGAVNSTYMAATMTDPVLQGNLLLELWKNLRNEHIYRRGPISFGKFLFRTVAGFGLNMLGVKGIMSPNDTALGFKGVFDTTPFRSTLRRMCPWANITRNIRAGLLDAVTVSATNVQTGEIELFVQKASHLPKSERIILREVRISPRHVMASAALPLLFPAVPIDGSYYNDGSVRLNTPLAPAVSFGASRILIIGTRYQHHKQASEEASTLARISRQQPPPTIADVLGKFYNAILLDRVENDRDQVNRINRILEACQTHVSPGVYKSICREARVQRIETTSIFPSVDIQDLVDEAVRGNYRSLKSLGAFERFVLRILEADPSRGLDLLSYFLFEPIYLNKLISLGFEDARAKHDELCEFAERSIRGAPVD